MKTATQQPASQTIQDLIGSIVSFTYGTSRGRETWGYNVVTCKVNGYRVGQCKGGGYDMKGTAMGEWMNKAMQAELNTLAATRAGSEYRRVKGAQGVEWTSHTEAYTRRPGSSQTDRNAYKPNKNYNPAALSGLFLNTDTGAAYVDGGTGIDNMFRIMEALGASLRWRPTSRRDGVYIIEALS